MRKLIYMKFPGEVYLVGGAVRDSLLDLPVKEHDWVVVGGNTSAMLDAGFQQVGKDFPVFLHPDTKEEYALARTERKTSAGHLGFAVHASASVTLEEDLARRDLTINAIAKSQSGDLMDPYGGLQDIEKRILRHVTEAFREDPLRVLRTARFGARLDHLGFEIAESTMTLMTDISGSGELETLSPERIWRETEKALATDHPRIFFEILRRCGALKRLYPEIDALFGVDQRPKYHPEIDAGLHTMLALDQICSQTPDLHMRFATLVHDLGKATTPTEFLPGHPGHEERGADLIEKLCDRMRIPNDYRKLAAKVARFHLNCHRAFELRASTIEKLLSSLDAWRSDDYLLGFVNCCMADARGRTGLETRPYPQFDYLLKCAEAAKEVDVRSLRDQGFEAQKLGEAIRQSRIDKIAIVKTEHQHINEHQYTQAV